MGLARHDRRSRLQRIKGYRGSTFPKSCRNEFRRAVMQQPERVEEINRSRILPARIFGIPCAIEIQYNNHIFMTKTGLLPRNL